MTSNRPVVLIVARLPQHLLDLLQQNFTCHNLILNPLTDEALAAIAPQVRGIAANGEAKVGREFMARFPALEIVSVFGVGYDGVDVPAARERGIHVTHTPDVLTEDVADMAIALMLAVARNVVRADRFARSGEWKKGPFPFTTKVSGARLGIVGLGRIGQAIAQRAAAFDMQIAYHNRSRKDVPYTYVEDIVSLAREVDFLVMITPVVPGRGRWSMPRCWRRWGPRASSSMWRVVRWWMKRRSSRRCRPARLPARGWTCSRMSRTFRPNWPRWRTWC
jgi:lactate dehydrogenase-like 2-hydroxyacid dehydrogenase